MGIGVDPIGVLLQSLACSVDSDQPEALPRVELSGFGLHVLPLDASPLGAELLFLYQLRSGLAVLRAVFIQMLLHRLQRRGGELGSGLCGVRFRQGVLLLLQA